MRNKVLFENQHPVTHMKIQKRECTITTIKTHLYCNKPKLKVMYNPTVTMHTDRVVTF